MNTCGIIGHRKYNEDLALETLLEELILKYQIKWCNNNKEQIVNNARKLYNLIISEKVSLTLKNRCCDFKVLETKLNQYILNQEKSE